MRHSELPRRVYRAIVITAALMTIGIAALRMGSEARAAGLVTMLLVVQLVVRFWYVIALLHWPATFTRWLLLTAFWMALVNVAWHVVDIQRWAVATMLLFAVGVAIEVHNYFTRQWDIGSPEFQRTLRNDIRRGIASATAGIIIVMLAADWSSRWLPAVVGGLIGADVVRLLEMVVRHRRMRKNSSVI